MLKHVAVYQEMYDYMASFQEQDSDLDHPADAVPHYLGSKNPDTTHLRMKQLEDWFRQYIEKRNNPVLFKACSACVQGLILRKGFNRFIRHLLLSIRVSVRI